MPCGAERTVAANGLRFRLYEWGPAGTAPALLLHSQAAHSHWWDWTAPLLADRFHVVALDLRGHGGSEWAEPPAYAFTDHVKDVVAVLDALGWRSPLVIGHSMGGYIGALLASLHPERVGALGIVDTLAEWREEQESWARRQLERPSPQFASREEAAARFKLTPPATTAPAEWVRHLGEVGVVERRPGVWEYAFDRRLFDHPRPNAWAFLPGVICPTLVVRGAGSTIMDKETWLKVTTTVQRGQFAEVKGASHHLVLDDPPQFVSLVTGWLKRESPSPLLGERAG
ncbi:MAG TPA: alpha/beta hydrolase [Methylomirabilota bacterium]|nr:alpha/beta hydrolase [Methylomirabilota bacterium]